MDKIFVIFFILLWGSFGDCISLTKIGRLAFVFATHPAVAGISLQQNRVTEENQEFVQNMGTTETTTPINLAVSSSLMTSSTKKSIVSLKTHQISSTSHFVRNAVESVGPSVVRIDCERDISPIMGSLSENYRELETVKVAGTGFVVSPDGYIMTNAHVVENAKKLTFQLSNGRTFKAKLVECDEFTDLAVLKADFGKERDISLAPASLGDSSTIHAGDWVIAVGCPVGLDFTVTLGVVSSPKRSALEVGATHLKGTYIQTDAALNSGNSGGPLVNDRGEVIGINTMVRSNTEAIGFAIPINRAKGIYEILKQGRKPTHAYFGIDLNTITPDVAKINNEDPNAPQIPVAAGALILRVKPGSPAYSAGMRRNDVILHVNGHKVTSAEEAESWLDQCKPGAPSTIIVGRGEACNQVELSVQPGNLHQMLQEHKAQLGHQGVIKPGNLRN